MSKTESNGMPPRARLVRLPEQEVKREHRERRPPLRIRGGTLRLKRRRLPIIVLLALLLVSGGASVAGFLVYPTYAARYRKDVSLAQTGVLHLQKAQSLLKALLEPSLNTQLPSQAKSEFASALKTFDVLNSDLQALPGFTGQVPTYGPRLSSARRVIPLAMTLSQAGVAASDALSTLFSGLRNPLAAQGHGITPADLAVVSQDVSRLRTALSAATSQVNQLQPSDTQLDARIAKLVSAFHQSLPAMRVWLNGIEQLLLVLPSLLGIVSPTTYLIEVLDSTELRPGGGFIGNYGFVTLAGGQLISAHITDVDLLDGPHETAGHLIPYPPAYSWFKLAPGWGLRNSNLDADFPTAARYAEQNYTQEGGNVLVQGVIAITPVFIQHVLQITGPIAVPEYHETITWQNLVARIHYHQLGPAGEGSDLVPSPDNHSSLRKRFTALLAEHLLARIHQLPSSGLATLLPLLTNSVRTKDIQLYFNSAVAESLLNRFQFDASIQAPTGDSLYVVDANVGNNKANNYIIDAVSDQVTIDSAGNAIHHAMLSYTWRTPGPVYGSPQYQDYVRVYVPPASVLLKQDGWQPRGTGSAFHRAVWMGYVTLTYGQTATIALDWKVPAAASEHAGGWGYQYLIQRQAGALRNLHVRLLLPSCASLTARSAGLVARGAQQADLAQVLVADLNIGVGYACT